jgi:hypothetical protein
VFGVRVVANSFGKRKPQEGWIEEGTGDPDGRCALLPLSMLMLI